MRDVAHERDEALLEVQELKERVEKLEAQLEAVRSMARFRLGSRIRSAGAFAHDILDILGTPAKEDDGTC